MGNKTVKDLAWPDVTVLVCTYDRPREIRQTLESLFNNLLYDQLRWHIADDGSPGDYVDDIIGFLVENGIYKSAITATQTLRGGWGRNVNVAIRNITTPYIYFTEDDYLLMRKLDLSLYVGLMESVRRIGMIRFGLAGHEGLGCYLKDANVSKWLPDYREGKTGNIGHMAYWAIERNVSAGPYALYKYSNRPHLVHRRFRTAYGYYPEGRPLAQTEEGMNHQIAKVRDGPEIVCPANWVMWEFDHIGVSRQGTEADLHA